MNILNKSLLLSISTSALLVAATPAFAQTQIEDEIVATAQKRDANVKDIPIAIEVFQGEALSDNGVEDLDDLTQVSSSFNINTSALDAQITIRGVGSQNLSAGAYGSTGIYVDGVYFPRPRGVSSTIGKLDDVESLQVLKGPQGTIFGRNATAGALVITTRKPRVEEDLNGSLRATFGDFGVREYQGDAYTGIGDSLAVSANFSIHDSDGFIENIAGPDLDDEDGYKVGGKLVWEPSDKLGFTLNGFHAEDSRNSVPFQQVGQFDNDLVPAGLPLNNAQLFYGGTLAQVTNGFLLGAGLPGLTAQQQGAILFGSSAIQFSNVPGVTETNNIAEQTQIPLVDGTILETNGDIAEKNINSGTHNEITQVSLTTNLDFEKFKIVNTLAYIDNSAETTAEILRVTSASIPDFTAIVPGLSPAQAGTLGFILSQPPSIGFGGFSEGETYSSDLYAVSQNSDLEWIVGLYYFREDGFNRTTAGAFEFDQTIALADWEVEAFAPYVEVNYPITDSLTVTGGLRYTEEKAEVTDMLPARAAANALLGTIKRSDSQVTYNAKLAYDLNDQWLLYGGYSTGFKSGSVNPGAPENGQVAPEEIDSIEVGFKGGFGDFLLVEGAAFNYQYDNLQLNVLNTQSSSVVLIDGSAAEINGLELSAQAFLGDNTTANLGMTLLDHEYTTNAVIPANLTGGAEAVFPIAGNDLAQTPDAVIVAGIQHVLNLPNDGSFAFNGSVNYNSGFWIDTRNAFGSGGDENDSFTVANASVKYTHPNDQFSAKLYINNITDEDYFRGGLEAAGGLAQLAAAGRPRHFGGTVQVKFD